MKIAAHPGMLAVALAAMVLTSPASAATPTADQAQVAGVYRQAIGPWRVTALFDGIVALPRQQLLGIETGRMARLLERGFVPEDATGLQTAVNAYLVRRGGDLVLVDTGTADCFGPGLGQVLANVHAAGIDPATVDHVLLTHAHPDHLCGLLDARGQAAYPNATVWLSQADAGYWLDPASEAGAPAMLRPAFPLARRAVAPYAAAGRLHRFGPDDPLPGGARALDSHGHTPGHVSYLFDDGQGDALLVWGDIVHYHAVQFARPEASFEADSDRGAAIASRRALLAQAAARRWWVAGAHLPFPGLGHVREESEGYAWVPGEFAPLPAAH